MIGDQWQRIRQEAERAHQPPPFEEERNKLGDELLKATKVYFPKYWADRTDGDLSEKDRMTAGQMSSLLNTLLYLGRSDAITVFLDMDVPDAVKVKLCYGIGYIYSISDQPDAVKKKIADFFAATDKPELRQAFLQRVLENFRAFEDKRLGPFPWEEYIRAEVGVSDPAERFRACLRLLNIFADPNYEKIIDIDKTVWRETLNKTASETIDEMVKAGDTEKIRRCCHSLVGQLGPKPEYRDLVVRYVRILDEDSARWQGDPMVVLLQLSNFYRGTVKYALDDFSMAERKARFERIAALLDEIPDSPPGEKLNAYKHAVETASALGLKDECRQTADRALAFFKRIPGAPERSAQISIPLGVIRRAANSSVK